MARTIPEEIITEIKRRADIAAIIGKTVKLKKTGRNLVGLCPFHTEKSPSFNVRADEGFFYCFGCKAAGDVVEFLVRTTGRGFLDVIGELAESTGVEIPRVDLDPQEEERQRERKRLLRVCELAQVFFRTRLQAEQGQAARSYLLDMRKLDEETIDTFGLGFGGVHDDGLLTFLKEQGLSSDDGVRAGVLADSKLEGRSAYDFYRHRITFPIRGPRGEIIAFGGRIFGDRELAKDGSKRPKYVNGPQTALYDKSTVLYGLFEAQPALKQGQAAVLVEGYLDVIAVHRAGLRTAVAPCGTSLTPRHLSELQRRTEKLVVCMDQDAAGKDAQARVILMALVQGFDVSTAELPEKDPDSLAKSGRLPELKRVLDTAPAALDALIGKAREHATGSMRARVQALDSLLPFLAAPSRDLVRREAIRAAARAFNEDEAVIANEVNTKGRRLLSERLRGASAVVAAPRAEQVARGPTPAAQPSPAPSGAPNRGPPRSTLPIRATKPRTRAPFSAAEYNLAIALLCQPALAPRVAVLGKALTNHELARFVRDLVDLLVRFHQREPREVLKQVPLVPGGEMARVMLEVHKKGAFLDPDAFLGEPAAAQILEDTLVGLDKAVLDERLGEVIRHQSEAEQANDTPARDLHLKEYQTLMKARRALDAPPAPSGKPGSLAAPAERTLRLIRMDEEAPLPAGAAILMGEEVVSPPPPPPAPAAEPPSHTTPPPDLPWQGDPDDDPWAV